MHKQTLNLLERLLAATQENRIQWTEVTGKTAFSYMAGEYVLVIDAGNDRASFRLSDEQGRTLDEANESDLQAAQLANGNTALDAVREMHAIAKRQNSGADSAIASVLEHLQSLGVVEERAKSADGSESSGAEAGPDAGEVGAAEAAEEPPHRAQGDAESTQEAAPQEPSAPENQAEPAAEAGQAEASSAAEPEAEKPKEGEDTQSEAQAAKTASNGNGAAAAADMAKQGSPNGNGDAGKEKSADAEQAVQAGAAARQKKKRSLFHPFGGKK